MPDPASAPRPAAALSAPPPAAPEPVVVPAAGSAPRSTTPTQRRPPGDAATAPWLERRLFRPWAARTPPRPAVPGSAAVTAADESPVPDDVAAGEDDALASARFTTTFRGRAVSAISRWEERRRQVVGAVASRLNGGVGIAGSTAGPAGLWPDVMRLLPACILCCIGIALTYGVCVPVAGAPERQYWRRQAAFLVLSLMLYGLIAKVLVPVARRTTMRVLYGLCCVGLPALVLVLGHSTGNGLRWLDLGGFLSVQPAEFAKLVLLWVVAELVNTDQPLQRAARFRRNLLALAAVALPALLIFLERSMGNTALLCVSVGTVLATRWLSWQTLLGLMLAGMVCLAPLGREIQQIRAPTPGINVGWFEAREGGVNPDGLPIGLSVREVRTSVAPAGATGLLSHCPDRFACYLSQNGGWNACQALRCVRIGGLFGCGYREGSITILGYLPRTVQHTDFIYCVLSESFGFMGAAVVLGLIAWLIVIILRTGVRSPRPAAWSFSVGFATLIFLQTLIHVGMALRILPIVGIPLPFVSYGGSFLLTSFAALGLVARYDGPAGARATVPVRAPRETRQAAPAGQRLCQPDLLSV